MAWRLNDGTRLFVIFLPHSMFAARSQLSRFSPGHRAKPRECAKPRRWRSRGLGLQLGAEQTDRLARGSAGLSGDAAEIAAPFWRLPVGGALGRVRDSGGRRGGDDGRLHRPPSQRRLGRPDAGARTAGHDGVCLQWTHFPVAGPAATAIYWWTVACGLPKRGAKCRLAAGRPHAALWLALLALRFVWIWGAMRLSVYWAKVARQAPRYALAAYYGGRRPGGNPRGRHAGRCAFRYPCPWRTLHPSPRVTC